MDTHFLYYCKCYLKFLMSEIKYSFIYPHSFIHSFVCLFVRSLIRSFVRTFVHSFVLSFVRSFIHPSFHNNHNNNRNIVIYKLLNLLVKHPESMPHKSIGKQFNLIIITIIFFSIYKLLHLLID